ncbi:EcoKI restriction-modification system protein HsdS [Serratia entomophila]|uniref:restriction endonuclease subunit S n=1 Tax=Serratia entomophila TaxID=42906 RepID=UPI00217AAFC3|nr:restriction endonuclease subunit S [Serratia entomophila]CAI0992417.1 EcoKI restriction-modification system protein HsdS [Serratia entomophila]CAI1808418.1 EcoKI restriction-modification system protein HsdS [Serratia entomophila]CAI1828922.1 EcoKI restriction-modification system protein HsdS [Serratia entomophila]CAI1853479.1 EcoKI restriction-modification system protein HsdS [Serratia entomophila]
MESKRKIYKLIDLVSLRNGAAIKQEYFTDDQFGIDLIKVSNFTKDSIDITGVTKVDIEHARKWVSHRIKANDILIATVGSWPPNWSSVVGKVVRAPTETQGAIQNQNTCSVIPGDLVNQNYLYYLLKTKCFSEWVVNVAQGSANQARVPVKKIGDFLVELPPIDEQVKVSKTLDALDVKITLNRQINQTLEQMAQALFKSWFVDFDPVVDNALDAGFFEQDLEFSDELLRRAEFRKAARESSDFKPLSNDIRQQFPAAFEECVEPSLGLEGWIPKGWQAGELGDVLLLRNERIKPSSETRRIPYVPIECIGTKEPLLSESKSGEEANSSLILFKEGDILFGAMRPYFHKVCIAPFNGVTRSTVFTLTAKDSESLYFSFFQAYQESTVKYATLHCEGSTIPYAKWKGSLDRKPIVLPTKEVQHLFHQRVKSFIEWGNSSNEQSQSLLKVRDTLLPKLISGELHLDEIETELVS